MSAIKQRESNIELLRLVVMAFIVLHHFIFHGLGQYRFLAFHESSILSNSHIGYALVADSFLISAVDVFILISGYFSIKFKASGFVKLFCVVSFFAVIGFCNYLQTNGLMGGVIGSLLRTAQRGIFVISNKTYWFIQYYFILMFLSGPINRYIENTTKKSLLSTIWILVFVNVYLGWIRDVDFVTDGYNLLNFVMLYLIGRYLRLHHSWRLSKKIDVFIYLGSSAITAVLAFALHHFGGDPYRAFCYNSPMVLVSAIAIFMFFTKLHFNSNVINYIASSCLAIYLMQEGGIHCYNQIKEIYIQSGINAFFVIAILVLFILSMIIPLLVDKIRLLVFGKFEKFLTDKLESLVFKRWIE